MKSEQPIYYALCNLVYLGALAWTVFLGADHATARPRRAGRVWRRVRGPARLLAAAWVIASTSLVVGVPTNLIPMGLQFAAFEGFQLFAAWVALPVALWYLALSGSPPGSRRLIGPLLVGMGATLFSTLAILPFQPGLTPEAERMYSDAGWREIGLLLGVMIAVPVEELVFRGVIQGWLETRARRRGWGPAVPVALAALLWTCGHVGLVEPQGIKEIQIFVLGLVFGWARLRWGLLGAMVAHGVLNSYACISQIVLWIQ